MHRRAFLTGVSSLAATAAALPAAGGAPSGIRITSNTPPRKVIIGTAIQDLWGTYPGLRQRLDQLTSVVDRMVEQSGKKYGRGPDLAILTETAITGEAGKDALACAVPLDGPVHEAFSRKASQHRCYIVAPTYLLAADGKRCSNAAILFGRNGEVAGTYRKVHLVVAPDSEIMESGSTLGTNAPVFQCDFGRLGIQICYDIEFDHGWNELARQGCELVAWPTQSPQTATPAFRAMRGRFYVVSSTWRHNASIFEPSGRIAAQIRPPESVLTYEIDLSYAILPWSARLENGKALRKKFGEGIAFHYYEDEDRGIFWSNDPRMTIREMVRSLGLEEQHEQFARVEQVYRKAGLRE
ncbi:MAG TPA: carbon-nitrogen hydrolase family protein [Bryobacteraceae bacterium]|nr:carbon-nitrogen hydrolase family protein [Bryobacteraceae bacterium]